jgi:O-antigen ligase
VSFFNTMLFIWIVVQTFYFGHFGPDFIFIKQLHPHHILYVLVILSFIMAKAAGKTVPRKFAWPERFMILLTILATISFLTSGGDDGSQGTNKWLVCLFNLTYYPYAAYFFVYWFPYRKEFAVSFLKLLCLFGLYLAITGCCEHYVALNSLVWPSYIMDPHLGGQFGRARGPLMESVGMGRMMAFVFAGWLVLRVEDVPWVNRLALISIPLAVGAEYFTETRGPWIGFAIVGSAFVIFKTPARKTLIRLGICAFVAALFGLSSKFSLGGHNLFLSRQSTVTYRLVTWITSLHMVEAHPFFGVGFGHFNTAFFDYYKDGGILFEGFSGGHNTFLTLAAELGIPGLALFLGIGILMGKRCLRVYRALHPSLTFERMFVVMTLGSLAMYYFTAWFSDVKWTTVQNTVMFVLLGVVAALERDMERINTDKFGEHLETGYSQDASRSTYDQANATAASQVNLSD